MLGRGGPGRPGHSQEQWALSMPGSQGHTPDPTQPRAAQSPQASWAALLSWTPATQHPPTNAGASQRPTTRAGQVPTSGEGAQPLLQGDTGVVGPEHLGGQAVHQVLQVPVQAGSLDTGTVGSRTVVPFRGISQKSPACLPPERPGGRVGISAGGWDKGGPPPPGTTGRARARA